MVAVTGITADRAQEIQDASVVTGHIDVTTGHLILTTGDATEIDAGIARPDAAIAAAVLVETNNRIADVNAEEAARIAAVAGVSGEVDAEEAARIAAIAALTMPATLSLQDGTNFTYTNTTPSATSGGVSQLEGTIIVPASGKLRFAPSAVIRTSAGGAVGQGGFIGFQVRQTNVSGTILLDTDDSRAAMNESNLAVCSSTEILLTGLTPGSTVYVRMMHWVISGATGACRIRRLMVEGAA